MEIDRYDNLETKAGLPPDAVVTHDEMMRTFAAFKESNDERIAALESRSADVLHDEKVERLNARFDELTLKNARPVFASERSAVTTQGAREHKTAFDVYMRNGESAGLRQLELKAMSVGSNPDGGYVVPVEIEKQIGERLTAISPIRQIAGVREISGNVYKKPFMTTGPAVGWVGETAARPQTDTPVLAELSYPAMELYAMPAATATLLEDAAVNLDEWLAAEVDQVFAVQEGTAFVTGDGINKPKGFLSIRMSPTRPGRGAMSVTSRVVLRARS